jgi:SAM-dependent methyltransferase
MSGPLTDANRPGVRTTLGAARLTDGTTGTLRPVSDDRLAREQEFHDARFAQGAAARPADRFYSLNRGSDRFFRDALDGLAPGSLVLDYGCGDGAYAAIHAAGRGLSVTAIDISPVAIEHARDRARAAGVESLIDFRIMNAEALELDAATFDFVCGLGVIHHLDIEASLSEVARVMRPAASAVFVEPLGHNPAINLYRRSTPAQRTVDEHPLLMTDLPLIARRFGVVEASYFHLLGLLAFPLRNTRYFDGALTALDTLDKTVLRTRVRRFAWMIGLRLSQPIT